MGSVVILQDNIDAGVYLGEYIQHYHGFECKVYVLEHNEIKKQILKGNYIDHDELLVAACIFLDRNENCTEEYVNMLEDIIATDSYGSYTYADRILNKRFEKGEDAIKQDIDNSLHYVMKVIKGEFKPFEDTIKTHAYSSLMYARTIRKRFLKGEEAIKSDETCAKEYETIFKIIL